MKTHPASLVELVTYAPECIQCDSSETRPVLCGDLVPIERCLSEDGLGLLALPDYFVNANRIDALTLQPNIARLYLGIISDRKEIEAVYWVILSAFRFQTTTAECFKDAEAHAMRWIKSGLIDLRDDPVAQIMTRLDQYFGHFRERLLDNVQRLQGLPSPDKIPVKELVEFHVSNFEKMEKLNRVLDATTDHFLGNKPPPGFGFVAREQEKAKSDARRALKRVTRLFQALNLRTELKAFISGQPVEMSHPDSHLLFVAQKYGNHMHELHRQSVDFSNTIPFKLSLFTKDRVFLGRLCVYAKQTPILDQLLSLVLHIRAGDELNLLETTNWYEKADPQTLLDHLIVYHPSLITVLDKPALDLPYSIPGWTFDSYPAEWDCDFVITAQQQQQWRKWTSAAIASWIAPVNMAAEKTWIIEIVSSKPGADFFDLMYALKKVCGRSSTLQESPEPKQALL